ncbi:hypothetical protein F938_01837 [Acinetobacter bereziniae LMG 1003 = CIP 70.12]|uniref:Uncharacterized protein n=2 Tax=Acinetobacter TaxID=469 RepID=N9EXX9_ACIBZ|nr:MULTISPECIES: hypothetical protein [Acinetobacter]ENV97508.1 hypothetical protein F938_01837 [Acinetobacter bereziniae LMG 1003 = CIP 70.12]OEY92403.1 hypothetical protein BJD20_08265 [Acinetobacter proteolyticus]VXA56078.1 conserved hypothetical protein [Acinetobacter proteolyticus]
MDSKIISDLALLEQNILENFCYYYQCDLEAELGNPLYAAMTDKIMLRMKENDFRLSEQALSLIEGSDDIKLIPFKPDQVFELLVQINSLREDMEQLKKKLQKKRYSNILMTYVDVLGGRIYLIYNTALERQAKTTKAAIEKHTKSLYPRREIICRVLREQVVQRGRKWDNPTQAVTSIIPILIKEFEKDDVIWIKSKITRMQDELQKLEQDDVPMFESRSDNLIKRKKASSTVKAKKINKIQVEIKKLESILHSKNPSLKLKDSNYKMPYNNTAYLDETIIHWLRGQPEILKEILNSI